MLKRRMLLLAGALSGCASVRRADVDSAGVDTVLITKAPAGPVAGASDPISVAVRISGRVGGRSRDYYLPLQSPNQAKPAMGQVCTIHWRRIRSTWHDAPALRVIEAFECEARAAGARRGF
jgi:hypothetical protein